MSLHVIYEIIIKLHSKEIYREAQKYVCNQVHLDGH